MLIVPIFTGSCLPFNVLIQAFIEENCFILLKSFLFHLFCSPSQKCQLAYFDPLLFFYIQYLVCNLFYVFVPSHFILGKVVKPTTIYFYFSVLFILSVLFLYSISVVFVSHVFLLPFKFSLRFSIVL